MRINALSRRLVAAALLLTGCQGEPEPQVQTDPVTYYKDVLPILQNNCLSCHRSGGIAPVPLETYAQVSGFADAVVKSVVSREMPPWGVDNTGDCNTYRDARWLTQSEIETMQAWSDGGRVEGNPADAPAEPEPAPGLDSVGAVVDMGLTYTPSSAGPDDYRCFVVDPGVTEDLYVTGFEVVPGNPLVVHHVIVYDLVDVQYEEQAMALDAAEEGPGYTCFGGPGTSNYNIFAAWAPGSPATQFPEGTGLTFPAGRKVVLQVHYNTSAVTEGASSADRTKVNLQLEERVDKEALIVILGDFDMVLPGGRSDARTLFDVSPMEFGANVDMTVYAVFPHMHTLGQTMDVAAFDSSGGYCAMQVPDWDFNWQQFYFFDQPLGLHYDELVRLSCAYDTREREGIVPFGEGTSDEMCVAGFYVTIGLTDDSVPASALGKPVADLDGPSSIASPLSVQYATSLGQRGYETMRDLSLAPDGTSWVLAYSESPFLEIGGERVSGAGGGDAVLLHYDEAGVPQQATFIGGSASDSMSGMDALPDGGFWLGGTFRSTDLQLAGSSFSSQGSSDLLFARVDPEGEVAAAYAFGGAGAESMRFIRALPDGGLIAATGFTGSLAVGDTTFTGLSADNQNGLLLLLNADGSLRLGEVCASESYCIVRNALVDHQGRLVVIGYFVDSATFAGATLEGHGSYDAFVASLSSSGELLWVDTFGDKATDLVRALQVDSQDNLYVGGYFSGTVFPGGEAVSFEGGTDGLLLSYTPDGTLRWSQIFTGIATDDIQRLILNGDDQLILAGNYEGNTHLDGQKLYNYGGVDILVAAYSTNGAFQWAERFGSRASEWSPALAGNGNGELVLGFGGYGGVAIDGQSLPVYGGGDIFLTRFDF